MRCRGLAGLAALGVVALAAATGGAQTSTAAKTRTTADAKTAAGPRTPDGRPDLQGMWSFANATPLERPGQFAGKETLTQEEAVEFQQQSIEASLRSTAVELAYDIRIWMERGKPSIRTALVVDPPDGRMPPRTADGEKREAVRAEASRRAATAEGGAADGPEDRSVGERCILGINSGPPMRPGAYNQNVHIFQTPTSVALLNEMNHNTRVIPLDGRPRVSMRRWAGESRGRWEGETLVVETTHFRNDSAAYAVFGATENVRLIERFTRADADTLVYEFTVDDPATWTRPWTAVLPMTKAPAMYEYACHEGNRGMFGILSGARAKDRAANDAARQ